MDILFSKTALKALDRIPAPTAERIAKRVKLLTENPHPPQSKKLIGFPYFRLRVGNYRVVYFVDNKNGRIMIINIAPRSRIYKEMRL